MLKYYELHLTIYKFSRNKIKADYSFIPLESISNDIFLSSVVSGESKISFIKNDYRKIKNGFVNVIWNGYNNITVSYIIPTDKDFKEAEDLSQINLFNFFKKRFFYKPKFVSFLKKRFILMGAKIN
jgi:hypothetical protein